MKNHLLLACCCLPLCSAAQNFDWAIAVQSYDNFDRVHDIVYAPDGSLRAIGSFKGMVPFGGTTLISSSDYDGFIGKLDNIGNWVWVHQIPGIGADVPRQVLVDAAGNTYALFWSTTGDLFKLDANGIPLWSTTVPGNSFPYGIGTDATGLLVTGEFSGTMTLGLETATSYFNEDDAFVAHISGSGNWDMLTRMGGGGDAEQGWCVGASPDGFILAAGTSDSYTFIVDSDTIFWTAPPGMWLLKMDYTGNLIDHVVSPQAAALPPRHILFDDASNAIIAGKFDASWLDFGDSTFYRPFGSNSDDAWVIKLDTGLNVLWGRVLGGTGDQIPLAIAMDAFGDAYIGGVYCGAMNVGGTLLNDPAICNAFAAKVDADGSWIWAVGIDGPANSQAYGIAVDDLGNVALGGFYNDTTMHAGPFTLLNLGQDDGFITSLSDPTLSAPVVRSSAMVVYPVPADHHVQLVLPTNGPCSIQIFDMRGLLMLSKDRADEQVDVSMLPNGSYVLRAIQARGVHACRLIVQR